VHPQQRQENRHHQLEAKATRPAKVHEADRDSLHELVDEVRVLLSELKSHPLLNLPNETPDEDVLEKALVADDEAWKH
jgi:hypothetical protein